MKIKQLEKVTKVFEKIQKLDKLAFLIVNNKNNISFELNIEKCNDSKVNQQLEIDSDGRLSYKSELYFRREFFLPDVRFHGMDFGATSNTSKENTKSLKSNLSETPTLQILGILLGDKQRERQSLLMQLKSYGVII